MVVGENEKYEFLAFEKALKIYQILLYFKVDVLRKLAHILTSIS